MSTITKSELIDRSILEETTREAFAQKKAFMGSVLASSGAVIVNGTMPKSGPSAIGKTIDMPYFGVIGEFATNNEGSSVTPKKLGQGLESATIGRTSLAFEVTRWASGFAETLDGSDDPYEVAAQQVLEAAERDMDRQIIVAASASPLIADHYSASVPAYLDWQKVVRGRKLWGDEGSDVVAMIMHSHTQSDLLELTDANGRPMLVDSMREGDAPRFCGIPLVISDSRHLLTGSTMGSVTSSGTTPPTVTLAGTPHGCWKLKIDIVTGGLSNGTATFRFSTDNGNTWSATYAVPSGGGAIVLDDSYEAAVADINAAHPADSLVGRNGVTGITATFANGTYNADNVYVATANIKARTIPVKRGAAAFWYNRAALALDTDKDILKDSRLAAMHLYAAAHLYRRARAGTKPGAVVITHNIREYVG